MSKEGTNIISEDELHRYRTLLESLAKSAEPDFQNSLTRIFPLPRIELVWTSSRFNNEGLPKIEGALYRIAAPFCDQTYGYNRNILSTRQRAAADFLWHFTRPSKQGYFPFFAIEFKSPSHHGTHWVAENQCAGFGAHRLRSLNELYQRAGLPPPDLTET